MENLVRSSDAVSLGFQAMGYLSRFALGEVVPVVQMAEDLDVSPSHLSKVMQRLNRAGIASSKRGVGGGFYLDRPLGSVSLLDIYNAIEGPLPASTCLLGHAQCPVGPCVMGSVLHEVHDRVRAHLATTTLADLAALPSFRRFGGETPELAEGAPRS